MFKSVKKWWSNLPDKKKWVDLITAALTVPVLVTVILTNVSRLNQEKSETEKTQPTVKEIIYITTSPDIEKEEGLLEATPTLEEKQLTPTPECGKGLPEFEISYPEEKEIINVDPVCIGVQMSDEENLCEIKWAYRVNGSTWSSYSREPVCLYNMATGPIKLEIRLKNMVSGLEKTYIRTFLYEGDVSITLTPTPTFSVR